MEKYFALKKLLLFLISLSFIFSMCCCSMVDSTCIFYVEKIDDISVQDYFKSSEIEFAKLDNVVIKPGIKKVNHEECAIFVTSYSKDGLECVKIKNICLTEKDSESFVLNKTIDKEIVFEKNEEQIYEGWFEVAIFEVEGLNLSDGNKFTLEVETEVSKEDNTTTKTLSFDILIKRYKRHPLIT